MLKLFASSTFRNTRQKLSEGNDLDRWIGPRYRRKQACAEVIQIYPAWAIKRSSAIYMTEINFISTQISGDAADTADILFGFLRR